MLDPMDISYNENFTIKTESENDSNLTNDSDHNIGDLTLNEIKQEPCDYKEKHNGEEVGKVKEECLDTSIDVKYELIEANQENNPLSDNIITLPKKAKPKTLGKKKKILVDPTVKFSVADIFVHCRGNPNLKPENIDLEEEYKNFKKSKNIKFSALLESVSKNLSCELKALNDHLEKGHKTHEESENPLVNISNIKEEVIDSVGVEKDLIDVCSKCANNQSRMKVNRLWFKSNSGEEYFCKLCLGSYPSIKQLKVHLDTHGTRSLFKCHQCTLSFSCKNCLSKHVQNNHESDTYTCHNCSKPFPTKTKLIRHMTKVHEGITYICATCLKTFPNKPSLSYHLKKHEVVMFHCAQCPKFYYIKESLKNHIFTRHCSNSNSSFRLKCRQCTRSFLKVFTLETHIRKCHNGKRFPCEKCDKTFSTTYNLKKHMDAMHKGKRITCPHCPEQFPYSQYLKHHIRVKHEGVKFKCKFCGKLYATGSNLSKHVRFMHCEKIPMPKGFESVIYGE